MKEKSAYMNEVNTANTVSIDCLISQIKCLT